MRENIDELDVVALTTDVPAQRLTRGQVGTVVHKYTPEAFEVEFVDQEGRTYAITTLQHHQVLRLRFEVATGT